MKPNRRRTRQIASTSLMALMALLLLVPIVHHRRSLHDGQTLTQWIMAANYGDPDGGVIGINKLRELEPGFVLPRLVDALKTRELAEPRLHSALYQRINPRWPGLVSEPFHWNTDIRQFRSNAGQVIASFGEDIELVQTELTELLLHEERSIRDEAAYCLSQLGTNAAPALPTMIHALEEQKVSQFRFWSQSGPPPAWAARSVSRRRCGQSITTWMRSSPT